MQEHTDELLAAKIIGYCFKQGKTIEELTKNIYKNGYAKNIVRIYQQCETLMSYGILIPKFQDRKLKFQVNQEELLNIKK